MTDRICSSSLFKRRGFVCWLVGGAIVLAVGGCVEGSVGFEPEVAQTVVQLENTKTAAPPTVVADSIDPAMQIAPELFSAEAWALWGGGRTLGGRWVALPTADIARRVRLINEDTGTQADGAMFRRDPNQTGPELAISSEAAEALGLKPGTPVAISIVALVHSPIAEPPEVAEGAEPARAVGTGDSVASSGNVVDIVPGTTERFATAEPNQQAPAPEDTLPEETELEENSPEDTAPEDIASDGTIPEGSEQELAAPESLIPGGTATVNAAPQEAVPAEPVEPVETLAAPPADAPPASGGTTTDGLHYIQAGIFGEPDNAARLVSRLRAAGLPVGVRALTLGARHFTRVVIGPYHDDAARDDALEAVKQIGAVDPIPVRD